MNIGFEILASILCVGRNSRLVKVLKEERNLVESIYVDVNGGEFGSLLVIEACCDEINLKNVEEEINETIQEVISCKNLTLNEIRKAIRVTLPFQGFANVYPDGLIYTVTFYSNFYY